MYVCCFCKTIEDQSLTTVERIFKEYQRSYTKEDPIIAQIEEIIAKGDIDSSVYGEENVKNAYNDFGLQYLITSDDDQYEEQEETTACTVIFQSN